MKYLFRVTEKRVTTLLRGVDFVHNSDKITFIEDGKSIRMQDLCQVLFNAKYGFVVFTTDEKFCYEFQRELADMISRGT